MRSRRRQCGVRLTFGSCSWATTATSDEAAPSASVTVESIARRPLDASSAGDLVLAGRRGRGGRGDGGESGRGPGRAADEQAGDLGNLQEGAGIRCIDATA